MHNNSEYGIYNVNQWTQVNLNPKRRSYYTQNVILPVPYVVRQLRRKLAKPPSV